MNDDKKAILEFEIDLGEDRRTRGRPKTPKRTHCKHGHELTPDNVYGSGDKRRCRLCSLIKASEWRAKNPERYKELQASARVNQRRWRSPDEGRTRQLARYGLTEESYRALIVSQNERCAICDVQFTYDRQLDAKLRMKPKSTSPCVDHCHKTGVVRGILCMSCNHGLGLYEDDSARLRRAADYLERPR